MLWFCACIVFVVQGCDVNSVHIVGLLTLIIVLFYFFIFPGCLVNVIGNDGLMAFTKVIVLHYIVKHTSELSLVLVVLSVIEKNNIPYNT